MKNAMPVVVRTLPTLARIHDALESPDKSKQDAAISVLSYMIRHIKERQVQLPAALAPHAARIGVD